MNEKFYELPEEKQLRIINAGLEVFGKNEYKRAVTDDIAAKAGISKGLLFYYFHNKRELYEFLFRYCYEIMKEQVADESFYEITDFFELLTYASKKKYKILVKTPYMMDFIMKVYFEQRETGSDELEKGISAMGQQVLVEYFKKVDFSRFRQDANPQKIMQMLLWMAYGYIYELRLSGRELDLDKIMVEFEEWKDMFRKISYKEEYL